MKLTPEMAQELAGLDIAVRSRLEGVQFRQTAPTIEDENPSERVLRFRTSDATVDAYGDILQVEGWDLSEWEKNRVFLWQHNSRETLPPIAAGVKDQLTKTALIQSFAFATPDIYPFADTIYKLYRGVEDAKLGRVRFLNMTSVGYRALGFEVPDEKKRMKLGMGKYGVIFTSMLLKEVSAVTVPANPNATILNAWRAMADKQALSSDDLDLLEERELLSETLKREWQAVRGTSIVVPGLPGVDEPTIERYDVKHIAPETGSATDVTFERTGVLTPFPAAHESTEPDGAVLEALETVVRELRETRARVDEVADNLADLHEEVTIGLRVRAAYAKHVREDAEEESDAGRADDWQDLLVG